MDEEERKELTGYRLGQILDDYSVEELDNLEEALNSEIKRVHQEREKKVSSLDLANSIFKL